MGISYKESGVDIIAGNNVIKKITPLVKSTYNENVLSELGHFGGLYDAKFSDYSHPVLVSSADGVGTKLKIAFMMDRHNTIGQCLVNHCVNDILCCGAKPLFFLDYFASGKLLEGVTESVIEGFVTACRQNGVALIGGETAEMPSMYNAGEYDVSGTIVGVVEKEKILNGTNIKHGDLLIGLRSTGLHTNGYSLARTVLLPKFALDKYFDELGKTLGESLLEIHRSYLKIVWQLLELNLIKGISHITGGGIVGNTKRILPKGTSLNIDWDSWKMLPIFKLIQESGRIEKDEMRYVFNLGIGMILIADKLHTDKILELCSDVNPVIIGEINTH